MHKACQKRRGRISLTLDDLTNADLRDEVAATD